jgi:Asp-tRNA(Asn)/Glu-tRNA(Gln) amidotransferase C subunit
MVALFLFISFPALSNEKVNDKYPPNLKVKTLSSSEENTLHEARLKLENAFDSYKNGDMAATKDNLNVATQWLNKAAENSRTEKTREEARKLATEIDTFREKVKQDSEQHENSLARFWHQTTSIIKREADQLIHSYVESSTAEKTLKYLLDAKMHLFTAEHDIFVSHDEEDAADELNKVLNYLDEASQIATPSINNKIIDFTQDIQSLKNNLTPGKGLWKKDSVIHSLDTAKDDLTKAYTNASPSIKLKIESIKKDIAALRVSIERSNIKNDYDTAMAKLKTIINEL